MHQCCAVGCNNIGVHLFPKNETVRKQWEIAVRRKYFKASKHSRLCSDHFKTEDYVKIGIESGMKLTRRILKKGVIPSLFIWSKKETLQNLQRKKRAEKREKQKKDSEINKPTVVLNGIDAKSEMYETPVIDNNYAMEVEINSINTSTSLNLSTVLPSTSTHDVGTQKNYQFFTIEKFRDDNNSIRFYSGLESYEKFKFVYYTLCPEAHSLKYRWSQVLHLSTEDQFFLTLIKLRRNAQDLELALFFDISPTSVSNIFVTWINFMYQMWSALNIWPKRDLVDFYMPEASESNTATTCLQ